MDIEKLPMLPAKDWGFLEDPTRPVVSMNWQASAPHRVAYHQHPRAQIIFQLSGVYRVVTATGSFVVPPQQAIWIPSLTYHETFINGPAQSLMLFVDASMAKQLADSCMVVAVNPLLAQLFYRAVEYGNDYQASGKEANLVQVLIDELGSLQCSPLQLPLANDRRLRRVMEWLLEHPESDYGIEEIAQIGGASTRTLARLFRNETGMTFVEWRHKLRLLNAIERLAQGQSVTQVALDLGYLSISAFIAMFRRRLGVTPSYFIQRAALKDVG